MSREVWIGNRCVSDAHPVFVIAEAGINHNGDMVKARELVAAAAECGADAVKFQTHLPEKEMLRDGETASYVGESLFDLLKRVELSLEQHRELKAEAEWRRILYLSTPFSREAADLLEDLGVLAFKIGSGEMTNWPLLRHVARKGKPVILSSGMSTLEEVAGSVAVVTELNEDLILMQCTSTYPARYEDVNLGVIRIYRERFDVPVGLSDHSPGIYTAVGAVAMGACVLEKHFTLDRRWPGPDQKASIEPQELSELVRGARAVKAAMGDAKEVLPEEVAVQRMARESVVALTDLLPDTVITQEVVWVKRPGTGIPARDLERVIGQRVKRPVRANTLLTWEDLS
ncbi:MAG: N-acetylneuraminate synthase family protein [Candidatus Methylomirabilales bacterium]